MPDHGRYDYDITTGRRTNEGPVSEGRESERGGRSRGGSIFGGGSRERERGYDVDDRTPQSGRNWTQDRENFSWGRGEHGGGERSEHEMHREHGAEHGGRDQGERMSSGWGPALGLRGRDTGRDRHEGGGRSHERETSRGHEQDDRHRGYGRDDERGGLPIEETSRLIGSNKVEGTAVYGRDGHRLGSIYNFMVDKLSGRVEYAVMRYGGTLGLGQRYYPLPWQILTYDTREGGYRIEMTERDLRDAPSFDRETEPHFNESYGDRVHRWYGLGRR
jgi:hypothetical protein